MKRNAIGIGTILAVMLAALAFPRASSADLTPHPVGAIVGTVVTSDGDPVARAFVRLINDEQQVVRRTYTGPRGHFSFRPVRPGQYVVVAVKPGVGTGRAAVTVRPGHVSRVRVELTR